MHKIVSRRSFIGKTAKGMAAAGIMAGSSCSSPDGKGLGNNFIHHVFFWLKQPVTQVSRGKFESALKELVTIETIVDYHLGVPAPTDREVIDSTYSYSLLVTFKDKGGQDIYQTHPKHLKFIEECQDLWERVMVYDSVSI